jgi:hypothetical protein
MKMDGESQKTVRVSPIVYEELSHRKKSSETFNEALRRILDLNPDIDDLTSYLTEEQSDLAYATIDRIESIGCFDQEIEQTETEQYLVFISEELQRPIAAIEFQEEEFYVTYKNQHGKMELAASVTHDEDEGVTGSVSGGYGSWDTPEDFVAAVERKVNGSYERWV